LTAIRSIFKTRNFIYFIRIIPYFDERNTYNAKKCDFDLSVQWPQLQVLFKNSIDIRNINQGTSEFCRPGRALARFSERHVTWFRPIASTYYSVILHKQRLTTLCLKNRTPVTFPN